MLCRLECARALLRAGADPNFVNRAGDQALFWAIDGGVEVSRENATCWSCAHVLIMQHMHVHIVQLLGALRVAGTVWAQFPHSSPCFSGCLHNICDCSV